MSERSATTRARRNRENGSALVEFALVFVVLGSIMFGLMGFGHALYVYHFLSYTARDATRFASVHGSTCNDDLSCNATGGPASSTNSVIHDYVTSFIPPGIEASKLTITPTYPLVAGGPTDCSTTENLPGCTVKVQLSYSFRFIFPLIRTTPISMSSTSELVISH